MPYEVPPRPGREALGFAPELLDQSVAELEGLDVPPGAYAMGGLAWLSRALVSPLAQLGSAELRLLLGHGRGLRWLLPLALTRLEREPFAAADGDPGALLTAALSVEPSEWARDSALHERLARVVHLAREQVHVLSEPARTRVADDLAAAGEQFGF
jgi:hypothetical protein